VRNGDILSCYHTPPHTRHHRDRKPENLFVTPAGPCDDPRFGRAKALTDAPETRVARLDPADETMLPW
jgi:hypothetical protein